MISKFIKNLNLLSVKSDRNLKFEMAHRDGAWLSNQSLSLEMISSIKWETSCSDLISSKWVWWASELKILLEWGWEMRAVNTILVELEVQGGLRAGPVQLKELIVTILEAMTFEALAKVILGLPHWEFS